MAERVPKITEAEKPTFNAAAYSDRLQETRQASGPLPPVPVFDKTKPDSIVPLAQYTKGKLTDTVNALTDFSADIKEDLDTHKASDLSRHQTINQRLAALEAAGSSTPFPGSGSRGASRTASVTGT